jgi:diguanylate cyclase (GGDEF)-like protein/PAS domain S-box-containing protein
MNQFLQGLRRLIGSFGSPPQASKAVAPLRPAGEADFRALAKDCILLLCNPGPDLLIRYVSPDAARLFGRNPAEILGRGPDAFLVPEDHAHIASIGRGPDAAGEPMVASARIRRPDGGTQWVEVTRLCPRQPATGRPDDTILLLRDIPERSGLQRRLAGLAVTDGPLGEAFSALTDAVTCLANRRAFDDALDLEWCRARRAGTEVSLLLLGLDGFKAVDDASLRAVAAAMGRAGRRIDDFAARYRGDDLALLLPNTPASGAAKVAHRIQTDVAALELRHGGSALAGGRITASLGAVTGAARPGAGTTITPSVMLAAVSAALDQARRGGCGGLVAAQLRAPDAISGLPGGATWGAPEPA